MRKYLYIVLFAVFCSQNLATNAVIEDTQGGTLAQGFLSVEQEINSFGGVNLVRSGGTLGTAADQVTLTTDGQELLVDGQPIARGGTNVSFTNITADSVSSNTTVDFGSSTTCATANEGEVSYDPIKKRLQLCNSRRFVNLDGKAFDDRIFKVFLSSITTNGNIVKKAEDLGLGTAPSGIEAGNRICQHLARQAGRAGLYRAYLSDDDHHARDTIDGTKTYQMFNDQIVNSDDLYDGSITHSIDVFEDGQVFQGVDPNGADRIIWTATNSGDIEYAQPSTTNPSFSSFGGVNYYFPFLTNTNPDIAKIRFPLRNCGNWTEDSNGGRGFFGVVGATNQGWTFPATPGGIVSTWPCDREARLYCFEI